MITLTPNAIIPWYEPAEKSALSVFLQDIKQMDDAPTLTPDHFHWPSHSIIFCALLTIRERNDGTDTINQVIQHLTETGKLDAAGGYPTITECFTYNPGALNLPRLIKTLNLFYARRLAIKASIALGEAAFTCGEEIERVLEAASSPITAIHETATNGKPPITREMLVAKCIKDYKDRCDGLVTPMGIKTITEIDERLRGLHPGRVWVIGGYPEGGKSVLAGQIITECAADGVPSLFLSMEMTEYDVMNRCMIQHSRIGAEAFMEPIEYARKNEVEVKSTGVIRPLKRSAEEILKSPLFIARPSNRNIRTVLSVIRRHHRSHGVKVVAIDYIQLISPSGRTQNEETGIAEISHAIQELAQELSISVLLLTQLNDSGETKRGRVIEEDADAFLQIVQNRDKDSDDYKKHQHILLVKDRHNGKGGDKIPLVLDRELVRFRYGVPEKPAEPKQRRR